MTWGNLRYTDVTEAKIKNDHHIFISVSETKYSRQSRNVRYI